MDFSVNWIAVLIAGAVAMAIGAAWYMILANQWLAAIGKTRDQLDASPTPFIIAFVCELVMAFFIAVLTRNLFDAVTVANGIQAGLVGWAGFTITAMILNHRYENAKWSLTAINGGYLLVVVLAQGAIIGLLG